MKLLYYLVTGSIVTSSLGITTIAQASPDELSNKQLSPNALKILCDRFPLNSRCSSLNKDINNQNISDQESLIIDNPDSKDLSTEKENKNKSGISFSPAISTLGPGVELTKSINSKFNARLAGNFFNFEFNDSISDVDYNAELNFESISAMGDFYPWKNNGFHLTLGVAYNNNRASGVGQINNGTIDLGGQVFQASDIGRVDGDISYSSPIAPYVGIGYGNTVSKNKNLGFFIRAGALITGSPDVNFSATPNPSLPQSIQNQIRAGAAAERNQIQNDLNNFPIYPVISLGISYQF